MMNLSERETEAEIGPLGAPKPIRYGRREYRAMGYFAEVNHNVSIAHVARVFAEIGIKLTKANGGMLPSLEQVWLRRETAHARRAHQRRKRR